MHHGGASVLGGERIREGLLGDWSLCWRVWRAQGSGVCSRIGCCQEAGVISEDRAVLFTQEPGETESQSLESGRRGCLDGGWLSPPLLGCDEGVFAFCSLSPSQDVLI